ncbi:hypothetical protein BD408DRAFT_448778 [Parasitella parasitica]|nr:hypothetical protein BD408DRAFT_448778 [Parasitella parasitica]
MNQSGATAESKEFGSRRLAFENQYAREKEAKQIEALKTSLEAKETKESTSKDKK